MTVDRLSVEIGVGFTRRSGPGWSIDPADRRKLGPTDGFLFGQPARFRTSTSAREIVSNGG